MKKNCDFVRPFAGVAIDEDTSTKYRYRSYRETICVLVNTEIPPWERTRAEIGMPEGQDDL